MDITDHIAATLNEHDIDDYVDHLERDGPEVGIYCIKCGWKGTTQREANEHLAQMIAADMGFTQEWSDDIGGPDWMRYSRWVSETEQHPGPSRLAAGLD